MQTEHLKVTGMTCGGCSSSVTRALSSLHGVKDVKVSLSDGDVTVQYDDKSTTLDELKAAVKRAGYGVDVRSEDTRQYKGSCCG